jgi:hypothetical protein
LFRLPNFQASPLREQFGRLLPIARKSHAILRWFNGLAAKTRSAVAPPLIAATIHGMELCRELGIISLGK